MSDYFEFSLTLMKNLELFFKQADALVKNKLMSSILEEKIEFDGQKYRTPKFKGGFQYIYNNIKELEVLEIKKGDELSNISPFVLEAGLEPARPKEHRILSPACLPIPPLEQATERKTGFEPATLTLAR